MSTVSSLSAVTASSTHRRVAGVRPDRGGHRNPRGLVFFVGLSEDKAAEAGTSLNRIAAALHAQLAAMLPAAETSASIISAPDEGTDSDLEAVRSALDEGVAAESSVGLLVDVERLRVQADGHRVPLAPRELDLLHLLLAAPGRTVSRAELIERLWGRDATELSERSVDVCVRRLRAKLGAYAGVVRTVRGGGYRYDPHPDVVLVGTKAPAGVPPVDPAADDVWADWISAAEPARDAC